MKVLAVILTALTFVGAAHAHRLSGHPKTYKGQLRQAQAQVRHDKSEGDNHWLARDRAYVRKLKHLIYLASLPQHYSGWLCITNGAYPGAPHEGNGYNGLYTGPLGMTTPWMGYRPPGSDWVHSNPVAVYWIAERVSARYGFSYSWMKGQWPNTYPPCAGHF